MYYFLNVVLLLCPLVLARMHVGCPGLLTDAIFRHVKHLYIGSEPMALRILYLEDSKR